MRNYIKINGTSSLTLKGFAIKELPPITKPLMRSLREEIDGRDGDIITELGYGAYDKEIEVGLYDGYEIDKIIEFFNSSGNVEFSNETGKYYKFTILEKIDFESLLKFRTAIITFHCQPFKYPTSETPVEITQILTPTTIKNDGNIYSRPTIAIKGSGTITMSLNGNQIFSLEVVDDIVIDSTNLEAYNPNTDALMNREVTGNIDNLRFEKGNNTLAFTGTITKVTISNYSRWL